MQNGPVIPKHVYNITVVAADLGTPSLLSKTFVFIHSDAEESCAPNFARYPRNDIEINDSMLGQLITQVHAVACGADIEYSLSSSHSSYRSQSNDAAFWIDSTDGSVFLMRSLDEYVGERIELMIKAEVQSLSNTTTFGVTVVAKGNGNSGIDTVVLHIQVVSTLSFTANFRSLEHRTHACDTFLVLSEISAGYS